MTLETLLKQAIALEQRKYILIGFVAITGLIAGTTLISIGLSTYLQDDTPTEDNVDHGEFVSWGFSQDIALLKSFTWNLHSYIVVNGTESPLNESILADGDTYSLELIKILPDEISFLREEFNYGEYITMEINGEEFDLSAQDDILYFFLIPVRVTYEDGQVANPTEFLWHLFVYDDFWYCNNITSEIYRSNDNRDIVIYDVHGDWYEDEETETMISTQTVDFQGAINLKSGIALDFQFHTYRGNGYEEHYIFTFTG